MEELNIILAGEITGKKAKVKLMLALGMTSDVEKIKNIFMYNPAK